MPPPTAAQEFGTVAGGFSDITSALGDIFGGSTSVGQTGTTTRRGTVSEQVEIDEAGIQKIMQDILSSEQGLASIFSAENVAGIYEGSVAKQASGDLFAQLAGEIAKVTAKKTVTTDMEDVTDTQQTTEKGGLLESIGGFLGL